MRTIGAMVVAAGLALAGTAGAEPRMVDRVAAVVNDDMITLSEVHERAAPELMRLEQEGLASSERRRAALKNALDDLIADRLLAAEQKALAIEVTDQEVEYAIDDVRKQNRMDPETFERALMAQGHSMKAYREKMRKDLAAMKLIGMKVRSKIKVSEEDIKAEYARMAREMESEFEVRARHIVIQVPKDADEKVEQAARERAAELARRARDGEDFVELAKKHSEGSSRENGGDIGFFKRGDMVGAFEKVAFSLQPGEISDPVRTPFGYHVIQVVERRAGKAPPIEQVHDELRERLTRIQMQRQTEQYVDELRRQAVVEVKIADLK
ncbi:MAG: peptidylprolyl isomerase [Myxococcales bacterium]|jgi:peptidyl-prolyl cis-trans isomerase SurA